MVLSSQHRQADAGVDAARIGGSGLDKTGARLFRAAQGLVLMVGLPRKNGQ
jgi:hypothetical protein